MPFCVDSVKGVASCQHSMTDALLRAAEVVRFRYLVVDVGVERRMRIRIEAGMGMRAQREMGRIV